MKRVLFFAAVACLMGFVSEAALQNRNAGQRKNFKIGIPPGQQAKLLLPDSKIIELSALNLERTEGSIMQLKGGAEIRFDIGASKVVVIRADEAEYDVNTAELRVPSNLQMTVERVR